MYRPRALSSRRLFSVTPQRSNLVSDLYVSQIKQFKPTQTSAEGAEGIKKFQLPSKPAVPSEEVSADAVSAYESAAVETTSAPSTEAAPAAEEDWFVFEEAEAEHH
ncbi:F1F0-ATPase complex, subunit H [Metschnikowia bicuspidata var. bicuspidata NRRL YB-4993]|uniref:F1F0-ATPase complex, subunit H n=1 Tax=Metschnikowia bicuspidata var. bicuspidata NRRL YB-4993 TaxID=869754 RepID=A0A1A0HIZ6_9ASCO|nr:F1F0-ATPase complex, subunit H [Metschnikowia bicuspidata var. bicuspidata NRRL YB-4993]OBA23857.1 F1F0-ATPase complex, subunit H [Metschnikowia bicuspidata var. bicuspidata NRRL YB-4993]